MSKLIASVLLSAGIAVAATPAAAADMDFLPLPETYDWSGLHIGGWIGAMCLDSTYLPAGTADPELAGCRTAYGTAAGYDMHFDNNLVVGIEGDYGWGGDIASNSLDQVYYSIDDVATIRGRLGMVRDDTLLYLTAGGAWAQAEISGVFNGTDGSDEQWHKGWTAGVGMEHALWGNLRLRLEYLYARMGEETYEVTCGCTIEAGIDNLHMARAGLIFGFGFGYEEVSVAY